MPQSVREHWEEGRGLMDCLELRKSLLLYLDDELTAEETRAIRQHLDTCPPCHRRAEYEERFQAMLRTRLAPHPTPAGLREQICAKLAGGTLRPRARREPTTRIRGHLVCIQCQKSDAPLEFQKRCRVAGHETGLMTERGEVYRLADTGAAVALRSDPELRGRRVEGEGVLNRTAATLDLSRHLLL